MRGLMILAAVLCFVALGADNAAAAPQSATSHKPQATSYGTEAITIPQMLSYQGKLADTLGQPVPNGSYPMMFLLYTAPTGGSPFWSETQSVTTNDGLFSVLLGSATPIGSIPDAGAVWLGMTVSGGPELTPRLRIASAAYAYLAARAADADLLQGKDTTGLDARYVNEAQANSVTGAMLVNGTVLTADVGDTAVTMAKIARAGATTGQVVKWTGSVWAPGADNTGGGSGVTNVYQDTGIVCVPNPITSSGNVKLDLSYGDGRYVNEAQSNSVTSAMITDANVTSADIRDTTVNTAELKDAAVTMAKLNQAGATSGQVIKWTGTAWAPRNDSVGSGGAPDSVPGSFAVTNDLRVYGKGRIGPSNSNAGTAAFVAGSTNSAQGNYSAIAGGYADTTKALHGGVLSGYSNLAGDAAADTAVTVCGGWNNAATGRFAFVGGGAGNGATENHSVVVGGYSDTVTSICGAALSGCYNKAGAGTPDSGATIAGGGHNTVAGPWTFVGGGTGNTAFYSHSMVGGGRENCAIDHYATVGGGLQDTAYAEYSTVGGGRRNKATADHATVSGGTENIASGAYAAVGGGGLNHAVGSYAVVAGGFYNEALATCPTIAGGFADTVKADHGVVGGGYCNRAGDAADDTATVIAGGWNNSATGKFNTIGGGYQNAASNNYSTVAGGQQNRAGGLRSVVGGGYLCLASQDHSFVGGGYADTASALNTVIGGGERNKATGNYSTVGGGAYNTASGVRSTVTGGYFGSVSGSYSTVIGGANDTCAGDYSLVAGSSVRARANADYTLAFGENCSTSVPRAVVFYHSGAATKLGVGVQTPTHYVDVTGGSYCDASGWHNGSSRELKHDIVKLTPEECRAILQQLLATDVARYKYNLDEGGQEHVGLIAEEAPDVLTGPEHKAIGTGDAIGFLMAAVKAQQTEIEQLKAELRR